MSVALDLTNAPLVSQTGVWTWDVKHDAVFADPVVSRLFDLADDEGQSGQPLRRMLGAIHPDDRSKVEADVMLALAGRPFRQRYRVCSRRLGERTIIASGRCFFDKEGKPSYYPGYIVDVSHPMASDIDLLSIHLAACHEVVSRIDHDALRYLFEALEQEVVHLHRASGILVA